MRSFLIALTRNPISLTGAAVTTASAVLVVTLFTLELFGMHGGAYSGIIAYLILPAIFVLGQIPLETQPGRAGQFVGAGVGLDQLDQAQGIDPRVFLEVDTTT